MVEEDSLLILILVEELIDFLFERLTVKLMKVEIGHQVLKWKK